MPSLIYKDPFLSTLVSTQNEDDAYVDVQGQGTFSDADTEKLVVLRAYIRCCIDNVKAPDDIFSTKKKFYEKEYLDALAMVRSKTVAGVAQPIFSIPISRG